MKVTVDVTAFAGGFGSLEDDRERMRASGTGGETQQRGKITMNFKMFLTVAVLLACALPLCGARRFA